MFNRSKSMLAAVMALAAMACGAGMSHAMPAPQAMVSKKQRKGLFNGLPYPSYGMLFGTKGAGICMAHQQRVARKRCNQRRHKRALKARGRP